MRRTLLAAALAVLLAGAGAAYLALRSDPAPRNGTRATADGPAPGRPRGSDAAARPVLVAHREGQLPAPVQDPAAAALPGGDALLIGGLNSADVSVPAITRAGSGRAHAVGSTPSAFHDAAAAPARDGSYVFGGGEPSRDAIVHVGTDGRVGVAGKLPAPASDVSVAQIEGDYFVVGGYTGTTPLSTIVRWRPGGRSRVVAHLPRPIRYAAVTVAAGKVVIAGGTSGVAARREIYTFAPATGRVSEVGRLPRAVTHAAAGSAGAEAFVIGGRGAADGTQSRAIYAVDPSTGRVRRAGHLPVALSDAGAATRSSGIVLAGGRDGDGRVRGEVYDLRVARKASTTGRTGAVPDVYWADRPNRLSPTVRNDRPLIYVPNSRDNTVDEIDPKTYRIVRHFAVGALPQHVVPSYDLKRLWVNNDEGNSLTPIDPRTGKPGRPVPVTDPYNLYFTPDGRYAVVMAERFKRIDFRGAHSMKLRHELQVPGCAGVNHADFTADGRYMLASCEFAGRMIVVDVARQKLIKTIDLRAGGMPQDVKLAPDGKLFYVADMAVNGIWKIDAHAFRKVGLIDSGKGTHGLYVSRDSRYLYASNRGEGSISLISLRTHELARKWQIPGGGSPDMGGVSADGKVLWLSGRYDGEVYAISTRNGRLVKRIRVGDGPHGLCVYPQPGRYSLGHTGVFR